jgi:cytoskeletal protein CcmA (bactofilin family)
MPYRLRLAYAWRCLVGRVRIVGDVDASHLPVDGYLEGTIRVTYSDRARLRAIAAGLRRAGDRP